jgi:hypothetical protein
MIWHAHGKGVALGVLANLAFVFDVLTDVITEGIDTFSAERVALIDGQTFVDIVTTWCAWPLVVVAVGARILMNVRPVIIIALVRLVSILLAPTFVPSLRIHGPSVPMVLILAMSMPFVCHHQLLAVMTVSVRPVMRAMVTLLLISGPINVDQAVSRVVKMSMSARRRV